jgi:replicative DNA helicase
VSTDPALEAERALLGALLIRPRTVETVGTLTADDFADQRHATIFNAIHAVADRDGAGADHLMVIEELRRVGHLARLAGGGLLHDLVTDCPAYGNAPWYAGKVREYAQRRRIAALGVRLSQIAEQSDIDVVLDNAATLLLELQVSVDAPAEEQPVAGLSTLESFVDETDDQYDWVIPGLLERQDRVIVVAGEGAGKSTLGRQVAVLTAAGRHPFEPDTPIPPQRTLIVDLENPPALVRRKTRHLVDRARNLGIWADGRAFRWTKPGGLDIRRPGDARLLERVIAETRPALLVLGPLYKAFASHGDGPEQTADEARAVLDRLRERYGLTMWLEHHAPLAQQGQRDLRPFGSALWSRWPEFGLALRKDRNVRERLMHVEWFRGSRDERSWPAALERDTAWPWRAVWDEMGIRAVGGQP